MLNQDIICERFGVEPEHSHHDEKLGIALQTLGMLPINGLRQRPENGTCGWYIWCGEQQGREADFYQPLHVSHIRNHLPEVERYLSLPPGYRFLVAGEHEEIWYDSALVDM